MSSEGDLLDTLKGMVDDDLEYYSLDGLEIQCKVVSVYDGDTCSCILLMPNGSFEKHKIRLYGYDAPEMVPRKDANNRESIIQNAKRARNYLARLTTNSDILANGEYSKKELQTLVDGNTKIITMKCMEYDKYGRLLASLYADGDCINDLMIANGHGYAYYGGHKED